MENGKRARILVGTATCGRSSGALEVIDTIKATLARLGINALVTEVGCIGLCYLEPLVDIIKPGRPRISYARITTSNVAQLIEDYLVNDNPRPDLALGTMDGEVEGISKFWELPVLKRQVRIALRNCGHIDPDDIDQYIARGGYGGFVKALSMTPEAVIEEVQKSGLRGRGGAGFPTGTKWQFCRNSPGTLKYIICNADEGDPGAFMDRSVLEGDPHAVLEGMLIGAYAMGASEAIIYCRAEYPLALKRLYHAIEQMEDYGLLGDNILGTDMKLHIKIKEGAGAFVCGEETALMAGVEGKRGMPRPRPPFPAQSGLWAKPTNINNVETWANVSIILAQGGDWYASYGTEKSKGTKVFALAGKINNTGLIEVPMGISLREIIYDVGGGILGDKAFKAVQTGGPSGGCIPASALDSPVDYESLAALGSIMGSGAMIVMDEDTCPVDICRYFLNFTQKESCGKCTPCRVGTRQMLGMVERIATGHGKPEDLDKLLELANTVNLGSLCGLGQTAPNPVRTTIRYFQEEYKAHIMEKRCPSLLCKELIRYYIQPDKCAACMICLRQCPVEAISGGKNLVHTIDQEKCSKCGTCLDVCPYGAVSKFSAVWPDYPTEPFALSPEDQRERVRAARAKVKA
ncbi:MAG: NADH-quinone oxidoreductase subunit NuoF [Chloroflexi bacterium]|nr:NADH-quinone oxidoreductase subunit NuoF [Chloroflexota bacterium]